MSALCQVIIVHTKASRLLYLFLNMFLPYFQPFVRSCDPLNARNASYDCRSIMIAPHQIALLPRPLRPCAEPFIATKLSFDCRWQVEASRIRCPEAPAGCLDSTVSHKRRM